MEKREEDKWTEDKKKEAIKIILHEISENGRSVRNILENRDKSKLPARSTFNKWLSKDSALVDQYARACELRAELKFESIEDDYMAEPQRDPETGRIDPAWVNLQRLKIDTKKWELSKMMPKKYGDRIEVDQKTELVSSIKIVDVDGTEI